jgi:hypothetical protein
MSQPLPQAPDPTCRRKFLAQAAALTSLALPGHRARANAEPSPEIAEPQIREYLRTLLLKREDVDQWLAGKAFPFCKYDAGLGYLHVDRDFAEGQDGAICRYRYDELDARRMIAYADQPCRINTYGDSFTSCEQVSDGETWQERLAAHLGEPIRNYGIGGYSVYVAYLRMLREERRAPARYIIFNIFDDDHVRNLVGWYRFKFGVNQKSTNPTMPHLKFDEKNGRFVERPNPCPTAKSVYDLCDLDRAYDLFHDDFYLLHKLRNAALRTKGEPVPRTDYDDPELVRRGILTSQAVIKKINAFAAANEKNVLYVLSYGAYTIKQFIETGKRFDQALVDFLTDARIPYVDLMQVHAADAARFNGTVDEGLARYFIGHYNPLGNQFCAFAIKDALVARLDPPPPAYAK